MPENAFCTCRQSGRDDNFALTRSPSNLRGESQDVEAYVREPKLAIGASATRLSDHARPPDCLAAPVLRKPATRLGEQELGL